jgi:hypothetical protein
LIYYTVTAQVRDDLVLLYESYMIDRHIPDLMATGIFTGATISRGEAGAYRTDYTFADRTMLDRYIAEHAPRLRGHFNETFPEGVTLSRSVWETLRTFSGEPHSV